MKAEAYECLGREREEVKQECHLRKKEDQHRREVKRRLNRYEDVPMYLLEIIKPAE